MSHKFQAEEETKIGGRNNVYHGPIVIINGALVVLAIFFFVLLYLGKMPPPTSLVSALVPPSPLLSATQTPVVPDTTGGQIAASGYGPSEEQAVQDAKSKAVEEGISRIFSPHALPNFKKLQDELRANTQKYLENVLVKKKPDPEKKGLWQAQVLCRLNMASISEEIARQAALKAFFTHRVVVMTPAQVKDPILQAAYLRLGKKLEEYLCDKGFRAFRQETARAAFYEVAAEFKPCLSAELFEEIKDLPADFLIFPEISRQILADRTEITVRLEARNRLGRLFAAVSQQYPLSDVNEVGSRSQVAEQSDAGLQQVLYQKFMKHISERGAAEEYILYVRHYSPIPYIPCLRPLATTPIHRALTEVSGVRPLDITSSSEHYLWADLMVPGNPRLILQEKMGGHWYSLGNWLIVLQPDWTLAYGVAGLVMLCGLLVIVLRRLRNRRK
jgi:hypothetical protein